MTRLSFVWYAVSSANCAPCSTSIPRQRPTCYHQAGRSSFQDSPALARHTLTEGSSGPRRIAIALARRTARVPRIPPTRTPFAPASREITHTARRSTMQATVQVSADGMVIANLDSDDYAADDDDRALIGLTADNMLDQCARVAIAAWLELYGVVADEEQS